MCNLFIINYLSQDVIKLIYYYQFSSTTFINFIQNDEKNDNKNNDIKYNELIKELNEVKNMLNNEKEKVKELNNKIILYEKTSNEDINKIKELEKLINIKDNELNNLKSKSINDDSTISSIKPGEKIITVNFLTTDKGINKPIACKNTDIVARLEEKLYNEYPNYKNYNTYLTVNGNKIKRFKSLDENGINDGNSIIINICDE